MLCRSIALLSCIMIVTNACNRLMEPPVVEATKKGILLINNSAEPEGLDPHLVTGVTEHTIIVALMEGLVAEHPKTLAPVPGVASTWTVSADGTQYDFYLRQDAKWSNGDPVRAGDFIYAWQRLLSPILGCEYAYSLYVIRNARSYHYSEIKDFSQVGVESVSDHHLRVHLNSPTAYFPSLLAHYSTFPVHPPTIEKHGGMNERHSLWTRPGNYVGNGPFQLHEWRLNYRIAVERNPHYWDHDSLHLKGIHFYPIEKAQTAERMFRTGALHVSKAMPPLEKIAFYRQNKPDHIRIAPYFGNYYYMFNVTRPPFSDQRVRQAFSLTVERKNIVTHITKGGQTPAYSFTPPGIAGYEKRAHALFQIDDKVAKARQLMAEAGYPGGKGFPQVELLYNTNEQHRSIAVGVQQMWKKNLGVHVVLTNQDWKVYLNTRRNLDYDIARGGWIGDYPDPNSFVDLFITNGGNNHTGWGNKRYDELVLLAARELNQQQRFDYFYQAEKILLEESPIIPVYIYTSVNLVAPGVKNWWDTFLDHHSYKAMQLVPLEN